MPYESIETGLELFLKTLDTDNSAAGEKYIALRERLERLFEWRDCENVEELTDTVFDRVIKKIVEGEKIENAEAFCVSVAKFVVLENRREVLQNIELDENSGQIASIVREKDPSGDELRRKRFVCLDRCLAELPLDQSKLLIGYFDTDGHTMIQARRALADKTGINLNSLRIRISRIKMKLEKCTKACCGEIEIR